MHANDTIWPYGSPGSCWPTGIAETAALGIGVHPNPNPGRFTIEFPDPLLAGSYYSVYDPTGRLLYQRPLRTGAMEEAVDLSRYGRGTYVLRVTDPKRVRHERVVLE